VAFSRKCEFLRSLCLFRERKSSVKLRWKKCRLISTMRHKRCICLAQDNCALWHTKNQQKSPSKTYDETWKRICFGLSCMKKMIAGEQTKRFRQAL
jgi:hypothetical protein